MWSKLKSEEKGFTLIELIIVIIVLGIISAVAVPKFVSLAAAARLSAARAFGGAVSGTILAEHSNWLINGEAYTVVSVLANTVFSGEVVYNATNSGTPASGEITANDDNIWLNLSPGNFGWTYTPSSGDTPAYLTENTSSDF